MKPKTKHRPHVFLVTVTKQMSKLDRIYVLKHTKKSPKTTIILRHCSLKGSFRTTSLSVSMTFQHEHHDKKLAGSLLCLKILKLNLPINKQIFSNCLRVF